MAMSLIEIKGVYMIIKKDGFYFFDNLKGEPETLILGSVEAFNQNEYKILTQQEVNELLNYIRINRITKISMFWGYPYDNIDFITKFSWIESISITEPHITKLDIINKMPNLVYISWEDPIPFNINNPVLKELSFEWHKNNSISSNCKSLRSICVTNCKDLTGLFEQICILPNAARVAIVKNFSVKDCTFMKPMAKLEYLGLSYFTKLESLKGIEVLASTLRYLDLDTGSKIYDHSHLKTLKKLEVLRITHKGIIKSLDFIQEMPMLKELVVVGPKLEDNNLSYCNHIPTLRIWR